MARRKARKKRPTARRNMRLERRLILVSQLVRIVLDTLQLVKCIIRED